MPSPKEQFAERDWYIYGVGLVVVRAAHVEYLRRGFGEATGVGDSASHQV
ncbi:MAG: hypothetical protein ACRDJ0_10930 [Actinomycetota bacterium]